MNHFSTEKDNFSIDRYYTVYCWLVFQKTFILLIVGAMINEFNELWKSVDIKSVQQQKIFLFTFTYIFSFCSSFSCLTRWHHCSFFLSSTHSCFLFGGLFVYQVGQNGSSSITIILTLTAVYCSISSWIHSQHSGHIQHPYSHRITS
jgi:hypothetical protein